MGARAVVARLNVRTRPKREGREALPLLSRAGNSCRGQATTDRCFLAGNGRSRRGSPMIPNRPCWCPRVRCDSAAVRWDCLHDLSPEVKQVVRQFHEQPPKSLVIGIECAANIRSVPEETVVLWETLMECEAVDKDFARNYLQRSRTMKLHYAIPVALGILALTAYQAACG